MPPATTNDTSTASPSTRRAASIEMELEQLLSTNEQITSSKRIVKYKKDNSNEEEDRDSKSRDSKSSSTGSKSKERRNNKSKKTSSSGSRKIKYNRDDPQQERGLGIDNKSVRSNKSKSSTSSSGSRKIKYNRDDPQQERGLGIDNKSVRSNKSKSSTSSSGSRKIKYNRDDPQQERGRDIDNKSIRSNKSKSSSSRSQKSNGTTISRKRSDKVFNDSDNSFATDDEPNERTPEIKTNSSNRSGERRKIAYNQIKTTAEERDLDGKSVLSRESARSRKSFSSYRASASRSASKEDSKDGNNDPNRRSTEEQSNTRESRKVRYRNDDLVPETAEERENDTRSSRFRNSARSSKKKSSSPRDTSSTRQVKRLDQKTDFLDEIENWSSGEEVEIPLNNNDDNDNDIFEGGKIPKFRSREIQRGIDWSSGDEVEIPLNINDDNGDDIFEEKKIPKSRSRETRRGINRSQSNTIFCNNNSNNNIDGTVVHRRQQRTRRGNLMRSRSQDGTLIQGARVQQQQPELSGFDRDDDVDDDNNYGDDDKYPEQDLNNSNNNSSRGTMQSELPSRRISRRGVSSSIASSGMVLGDPSRRAPPSRCKSQIVAKDSLTSRKGIPGRSQSNDFALFLRQGRQQQQQQIRPSRRSQIQNGNNLKFGEDGDDDDDDNPFEVINKGPYETNSSINFLDENYDDNGDGDGDAFPSSRDGRQGKLTASKSGRLLKASSKDTISRVSARSKMMTGDEEEQVIQHAKSEREKNRRAEYNRSIAAATMAGSSMMSRRSLTSTKPQRQVKRQNSSRIPVGESVSKLESGLEAR